MHDRSAARPLVNMAFGTSGRMETAVRGQAEEAIEFAAVHGTVVTCAEAARRCAAGAVETARKAVRTSAAKTVAAEAVSTESAATEAVRTGTAKTIAAK